MAAKRGLSMNHSRGPYKRRLHKPLFEIPFKTNTKQGKRIYQRLWVSQVRADEKKQRKR